MITPKEKALTQSVVITFDALSAVIAKGSTEEEIDIAVSAWDDARQALSAFEATKAAAPEFPRLSRRSRHCSMSRLIATSPPR